MQTRERRRWVRELAGTIRLAEFGRAEALRDELACRLFRAVVGASRLPLHSVEAPLPAFSLGRLFYRYRPEASPGAGPLRTADELANAPGPAWSDVERAKLCLAEGADIVAVVTDITLHLDPEARTREWIAATRRA